MGKGSFCCGEISGYILKLKGDEDLNEKLERIFSENLKNIFGYSLSRLNNIHEAEELTSDIIFEMIKSADKLDDESRIYGYMWKIASSKYVDFLRGKHKLSRRNVQLCEEIAASDSVEDDIIRSEEMNLLRRELSLLSKQYRQTTILYYVYNLSCTEISRKLKISTEMVKYYLFRARKIIKEGVNMERLFGVKSYNPENFAINFWGTKGGNDDEYHSFCERRLKGNILLAAYYCPTTIQELSTELGVALPYLEDEIAPLIDKQYLTCKNDKYLTNIPIFTNECMKSIEEKLDRLTDTAVSELLSVKDEFADRFGSRFKDENLLRWQKLLLSSHFAIRGTEDELHCRYGDIPEGGPYAAITGGKGIVWGQSSSCADDEGNPDKIMGIFNNISSDRRGAVIAINFEQITNAQLYYLNLLEPLTSVAVGEYDTLSEKWKAVLNEKGYVRDKISTFPVYTESEYVSIKQMLHTQIEILSELNLKTAEIASAVTADLAPAHIKKTADYVGAFVYRLNAIGQLAGKLCRGGWLHGVDDREKPAVCAVIAG